MSFESELTATNISKSYKKRLVVDSFNMSIKRGEIKGILGPNGAGKSTTFELLAGLELPDSGDISLDKHVITNYNLPKRAKLGIAYLPQEASIFEGMTVKENIYAPLEMRKDLRKSQKKEKLEELITKFNLDKVRNTYGKLVSGGERRRVEVARSLAIDPKYIMLDEPFAGIDPVSISEIKEIIMGLKKSNIGIIITDHNVRETLKICDSASIMNDGKIIASGSASEILNNAVVKKVYLGSDFSLS